MKKAFGFIISVVILFGFFAFVPEPAQAAEPLVPCEGTSTDPCSFCHLVQIGNNVINWFFGLVFILFGVITFVAGFNLMTSGGNQSKLDDAKTKLTNAVVGLIIVFAAWLIVDSLMKILVADGDVGAATGSRLGMWHTIQCDIATES